MECAHSQQRIHCSTHTRVLLSSRTCQEERALAPAKRRAQQGEAPSGSAQRPAGAQQRRRVQAAAQRNHGGDAGGYAGRGGVSAPPRGPRAMAKQECAARTPARCGDARAASRARRRRASQLARGASWCRGALALACTRRGAAQQEEDASDFQTLEQMQQLGIAMGERAGAASGHGACAARGAAAARRPCGVHRRHRCSLLAKPARRRHQEGQGGRLLHHPVLHHAPQEGELWHCAALGAVCVHLARPLCAHAVHPTGSIVPAGACQHQGPE